MAHVPEGRYAPRKFICLKPGFGCLLILLGILFPSHLTAGPDEIPRIRAAIAFPELRFDKPLFLTAIGDHSGRLCVVEQGGKVYFIPNDSSVKEKFVALDLSDRVRTRHMEEGLLGLAFAPDLGQHPYVFVYYSASKPRRTVLSRFQMNASFKSIDPESEKVILEILQPYGNHNGGMLAFGPGEYLFVSVGDGGGAGDRDGYAQRLNTLLGKILRLDVLHAVNKKYAVPKENPFANDPHARGEIWAYGLRNVWRFSFNTQTGDLWAGDVGQDKYEEINRIEGGGNYGWNLREGFHAFQGGINRRDFKDPLLEHGRTDARSITGGYVYHGKRIPELKGYYCYGDFVTGRTWLVKTENNQILDHRNGPRVPAPASFGLDENKEIYICSYDGRIYTFQPA